MASPHLRIRLDFVGPRAVEVEWILAPSNNLFSTSMDFVLDICLLKMAPMALRKQVAMVVDPPTPLHLLQMSLVLGAQRSAPLRGYRTLWLPLWILLWR